MSADVNSHEFFMSLAIDKAWESQLLTYPNPAVGALLLNKNGKIIALQGHKEAGKPHAEVLALQEAYADLSGDDTIFQLQNSHDIHAFLVEHHAGLFKECTLYVTLEPCNSQGKTPACSYLIQAVGIKKVFIGTLDPTNSGGAETLEEARIVVEKNICAKESNALIEPFLAWSKDRFVICKWAQHQNGVIDGGVISDESSRKHMHKLRSLCDTLVIGGNTVRNDRPTLDARLVNDKAPDVLILSNEKDLDQTIPLFSVENREVVIGSMDSLQDLKGLIMIETGVTLLEHAKEYVNWFLVYQTPHIKEGKTLNANVNGHHLKTVRLKTDYIHWIKRIENE